MSRLRPYLVLRDLPLWLGIAGLTVMALSGGAESLRDPGLALLVVLVVGSCAVTMAMGRVLVRRIPYTRTRRVAVALVALLILFPLLGGLAFFLLPAAFALLAVELVAAHPVVAVGDRLLPPDGASPRDAGDFEWPEEDPAQARGPRGSSPDMRNS